MKFVLSQKEIITPLQLVSGAVEKRQTLPILSNILMVVDNNQLSLTATDLEVELVAQIPLEGESEDGEITVPGRKLLDICRSLDADESIRFILSDQRLKLQSAKSRFTLTTLPASEYPNIEETAAMLELEVEESMLKTLISQTSFAMAQQDVRYYLNGMLMEFDGQKITVVATDGHRLAMSQNSLEADIDEVVSIIAPRKGVIELSRLLESDGGTAKLVVGSNHLQVKTDRFGFTSKLVDGRFPDYRKVLPKGGDKEVSAHKESLKESLARAAILCNEKFRGVRLMLESGNARILANNPEQEEAEVNLAVDYNGADLEIGFNVSYLLDILNTVDSEQIKITLGDANSSALVEEIDGGDNLYVVMPMRL